MSYFTKENITFMLALIGSLGTITGWIYTYISTRKNINMRVVAYSAKDNKMLLYLSFENKSRLTISITDLALKVEDTYYSCRHIPQRVTSTQHYLGNQILNSVDYYNIQMPIELGGLGSTSGYVLFVLPKGIYISSANVLTFQVSSNRGKAFEMKLSLAQTQETL